MRKSPLLLTALLMLAASGGVLGQERPAIEAAVEPRAGVATCVDFSNLGTNNPKIKNSCGAPRTVGVVNYRSGNYIGSRVFHLWRDEERPLAFPGDYMAIDWIKDWTSDGSEDGAAFLTVTPHKEKDYHWWEVRNSSSDRFNAFQYIIFHKNRRHGIAYYVLPPGQSGRIYGAFPDEQAEIFLEWSRLDPR